MKKTTGAVPFFTSVPSLKEALPELRRRLETDTVLSLVSVHLDELNGSGTTALTPVMAAALDAGLNDFCAHHIRRDDLAAVIPSAGRDALPSLQVFLSKSREKWHAELNDLERIAVRAHEFIYNRLFHAVFSEGGHGPRLRIGYGLAFFSPSRPPDQVVGDLIGEAELISRFLPHKVELLWRLALQDVLRNLRVVVTFQPIISLADGTVSGYLATAGGQGETFLENTRHLVNYAAECGAARELTAVCRRGIVVKASRLEPDRPLFLEAGPATVGAVEADDAEFERLLREHDLASRRLVFILSLRDLTADPGFAARVAARFPAVGLALELDESWDGRDLPLLSEERMGYILTRGEAAGPFSGREEEYAGALTSLSRARGKTLVITEIRKREIADAWRSRGATLGVGPCLGRDAAGREELALVNTDLSDRYQQKKLLLSIYLKRGREYFGRPDYDKAILEFSKVLEIDPVNADSLYLRGYAYAADRVPAMAVRDLLKLREIDPGYPHLLLLEGFIAERKGDRERALRTYREYLTRAARFYVAETTLAQERIASLSEEPV